MKRILSIQSHVASGYVGNRAAIFPLQRLGHDVSAINTVQFSNHTGYGTWTGQVFDEAHIRDVLAGLAKLGVLAELDAILTGYLGNPALGALVAQTVHDLRLRNPGLIWACDPVMGDVGRGFFVHADIPPFFKDSAAPAASILTPNQFELTALTGIEIKTLADARAAIAALHAGGAGIILLTSLDVLETPPGTIQMMAADKKGAWITTTPRLPLSPTPNGAGDATAALFLGHYLEAHDIAAALSRTADGIFAIFEETQKAGSRELALIQAQDRLSGAAMRFKAEKI